MSDNNNFHVIFNDRLGFPKIWHEDMKACSTSFGKPEYPTMVARFENDIINISDGANLKDKIQEFKDIKLNVLAEEIMNQWRYEHPIESQNPSYIKDQENLLAYQKAKILYNFIIQLLDNEGFGFYRSRVKTDETSLNSGFDDYSDED